MAGESVIQGEAVFPWNMPNLTTLHMECQYFFIKNKYGTFASIHDYKDDLVGWRKEAFDCLKEYYDTNLLSNLMAPMMDPAKARNCLWVCEVI